MKTGATANCLATADQLRSSGLMLVLTVLSITSLVTASVAIGKTQESVNVSATEEIPLIAEDQLDRMIAKRQAALEQRREGLVDAIGNLGSNHPSVAVMQAEREELDDQITIWSSPIDKLLSVEDRDLRVLVLQLTIRVDQLETENRDQQYRIQRAQSKQNVFHSSGPSPRRPSRGGSSPPGPPRPR